MLRPVAIFLIGALLGSVLTLIATALPAEECRVVTSGDPSDPTLTRMVNEQGWSLRQIAVYPSGYADWHLCHH